MHSKEITLSPHTKLELWPLRHLYVSYYLVKLLFCLSYVQTFKAFPLQWKDCVFLDQLLWFSMIERELEKKKRLICVHSTSLVVIFGMEDKNISSLSLVFLKRKVVVIFIIIVITSTSTNTTLLLLLLETWNTTILIWIIKIRSWNFCHK